MRRYQLEEFYQLMDAKIELDKRKISYQSCSIAANAIIGIINIMVMINCADDNVEFTAKEIFDALYKDVR